MPHYIAHVTYPSVTSPGTVIENFESMVAGSKEEAEAKLRLVYQTASQIEVWCMGPTDTERLGQNETK